MYNLFAYLPTIIHTKLDFFLSYCDIEKMDSIFVCIYESGCQQNVFIFEKLLLFT